MAIQSLSICVPAGCPNNCKFCVSRMHENEYENAYPNNMFIASYDYRTRLAYAKEAGCNTLIFTGTGEPMANLPFILGVAEDNVASSTPFRNLELQTSGFNLTDKNLSILRSVAHINTISLSLSSIWSSEKNAEYNGSPKAIDLENLCTRIKVMGFNLRLSLNMTDEYDRLVHVSDIEELFDRAERLGANQLTFRKLYVPSEKKLPPSPESGWSALKKKLPPSPLAPEWSALEKYSWVKSHSMLESRWGLLTSYIKDIGTRLERLPFGAYKYAVRNMSIVLDDDCMSKSEDKEDLKYLILRPDLHLYSKWDERASLIF